MSADLLAACPSCDTCGAHPCQGGCRTAVIAGEDRHYCSDEDACRATFNRKFGGPADASDGGSAW